VAQPKYLSETAILCNDSKKKGTHRNIFALKWNMMEHLGVETPQSITQAVADRAGVNHNNAG
jgi:hypothetical protein